MSEGNSVCFLVLVTFQHSLQHNGTLRTLLLNILIVWVCRGWGGGGGVEWSGVVEEQ